jgi:putative membrane protein
LVYEVGLVILAAVIQIVRSLLGGFLMGAADLVPGVSGGTIALVIGIYERLIASIKEASSALGVLLKGSWVGFTDHLGRVEWLLVIPLLVGILTAVISLASLLEHQLETNPTIMAGAFFGLVLGSVLIAWRLVKQPHSLHYAIGAVVAIVTFVSLGLGEETTVTDPSLVVFFLSGALAICAMILPGISGSLILLLIGMYPVVLGAVNDRDYAAVGVFVLGAIVGLAIFSQVLHWALANHHDVVLAGLVGLMAGSLRVLWPWPEGVESSALGAPGSDVVPVVIAAVVGLVLVYVISLLATGREKVNEPQPIS